MSRRSQDRAKAAETLLAEVEERGHVVAERRAGFSYLSLTRDGYCRASVTFAGMGVTCTTSGTTAREALAKAYAFHKMKVDGLHDAGTY
jgi:hypothetical protein